MNSEFLREVGLGLMYSLGLSLQSIVIFIPLALVLAFLLKGENKIAQLFLYMLDVFIALPNQLLLLTLAGLLGGSWQALLISVGVTQMPGLIRHLRVYVVRAFKTEHIEATRALGASKKRLIYFHILPRLAGPLSVMALALIKRVILSEALLTFLGLGFDPLTPSLGRLLSEGRDYLFLDPARFICPVIVLITLLWGLQSWGDRFSTLFKLKGVRYL